MRKLLKQQGHAPRVMITDKLGSYAVAGKKIMPDVPVRIGDRLHLCQKTLARMRYAFARGTIRRACAGCSWAPLCSSIATDDYAEARINAATAAASSA